MHDREAGRAGPRMLAGVLLLAAACAVAWWHGRAQSAGDALFPRGSYAYLDDEPDQLFDASAATTPAGANARSTATSARHPIRISLDAARRAVERGTVAVVLPENTRYDVRFEREERASTGDWTFIGRVATPFGDLASVLTFGPDGVFGTLPAPDGRVFHITTRHGVSSIAPAGGLLPAGADALDGASDIALPPRAPSAGTPRGRIGGAKVSGARPPPAQTMRARAGAVAPQAAAPGVDYIDVLGVYTADLVSLRGSASAAETEFANLVAITNQAHVDSGTRARFRLVRLVQTEYPGDRGNTSALYAMTGNALPDGLDLAALRQEVTADLVAMVRPFMEGDTNCGIAWLNGAYLAPDNASADYGFSVSSVDPCGPLVLAHEIGHNLGSTHDAPNATAPGAYDYSMGYRQEGPPGFGTVMAYAGAMPWIARFSDPGSHACEAPCGTASTDNVRSIDQMAPRAARFVNPHGTIVIDDASIVEGDVEAFLPVRVRLGAPAAESGVWFEVRARDGTAKAGEDFGNASGRTFIPPGERDATVLVAIAGDEREEADETFELVLADVVGATLHRGEAVATIVNDDPRVRIQGRLVFPEGVEPPSTSFLMHTYDDAAGEHLETLEIASPTFAFELVVVPGTPVVLELLEHPEGFAEQVVHLGQVTADVERQLVVSPKLRVSGKLVFAEGVAPPSGPVDVVISQQGASGSFGYYVEAAPPTFEFARDGYNRGAKITIRAQPGLPFYQASAAWDDVQRDVHAEIAIPATPELVAIVGSAHRESDPPSASGSPVAVRLGGPAPTGGTRVRLTAVSDTATAGEDFSPFDVVLQIPEGETEAVTDEILWILSDDLVEGTERFQVVAGEVVGARPLPGVSGRFEIHDDDYSRNATLDVDGDGASDLLWHSRLEQRVRWRLMRGANGQGFGEKAVGNAYGVAAIDDLNADGEVDLLWQDDARTKLAGWVSYAGEYEVQVGEAHPGSEWHAVGSADPWGAGHAQPLWLAQDGSRLRVGLDAGTEFDVPPGVRLAATGDFDGDGREDLLWQEGTTNRFLAWHGRADHRFEAPGSLVVDVHGGTLVGAADVDGDGRDELLWHGGPMGTLRWWSIDGGQATRAGEQALPSGHGLVAIGDYSGDGRSDLVWRDARRTRLWLWRAWRTGFVESEIGEHPGGDWAPIQVGLPDAATGAGGNGGALHVTDVDGDGRDDLVWHNASIGQLDWWRMQAGRRVGLLGRAVAPMALLAVGRFDGAAGGAVWQDRAGALWLEALHGADGDSGLVRIAAAPAPEWRFIGVADIDGDGRHDLLWQDPLGRQLHWWLMDGAGAPRQATSALPPGFTLATVGDLDGNGRDDLVWHDAQRGEVVLWRLRDAGPELSVIAGWPAGDAVQLRASGDIDGDGRSDLLWLDRPRGTLVWWRMGGAARVATRSRAVPPGYALLATGDLDGDGVDEILWHDRGRDELRAWTTPAFGERVVADHPGDAIATPRMVTAPDGP